MKKRFLSLLLALALLLSLSACASKKAVSSPASETEAPAAHIFTDDCGREIAIPNEITAVVPSGPVSQLVLFAIAPDLLAGLASRWKSSAEGIIPAQYWTLPYFGELYSSADLNVEELAAAGPQLIIDIGEAKKSIAQDMNDLEAQTQIPSVHIEAALAAMPEAFRKLGSILGKEEKGEELAQFCERVYQRTLFIMEKVGDNKANALYILGEDGLNVLANGSYHAEILDLLTNNLAVVENPTSKGSGNEVSMEQIALWNPDFILFAPGSIYAALSEQEAWKELTAVRTGNYVEVPEGPYNWMGTPPGVQRYLGLIWLTSVLYPEYCDYDVKAEIMEFYELFYGCTLTDAQYAALTVHAFPG